MTHTHPVPDVEETLLIGQVEHQQEAHGVPEEGGGEAAEPEHSFTVESSDRNCWIDCHDILKRHSHGTQRENPDFSIAPP